MVHIRHMTHIIVKRATVMTFPSSKKVDQAVPKPRSIGELGLVSTVERLLSIGLFAY